MSSSTSSSERSSRAHSLSSTSLSSSRSSSSFFYHNSDASSLHTEASASPPSSPNLHTSSQKTKDFIAAASAKLSKAREQVSHALSDATPKESKFRLTINPAIVEEDVGYESDDDVRGANMKAPLSPQKTRPKFLRVDTKQRKRAASILSLHPFSATTKAAAPNSHKRSLARLDVISNTRAVPDYELTPMTISKLPAGLGLALPSVHISKPIPRACTMPTMKSSSGHNLKDSLPHHPPNLPPQTSYPREPPKVYLRPIELPGTPSPMELLPPSIILCESLSGGVMQSSSMLPSPAEELSPLWTLPPLADFATSETTSQSPLLLGEGGNGGWNPYFPSI
ncbi:hypothetical protein DEU56DRAFT_951013 [Suillus clintonianus]|uniref:uncharacterized protein n=1 Tax=Suillus clintonianus TaxID=1904413 RepID=UPI001B8686FF|nr:uncharacterized protein DEU56DRAFT_951013 [Suillus clintonianus]KAG2132944.1 hypothetical protein DEU56DRAFT_951013 [Suillus clintonianus]